MSRLMFSVLALSLPLSAFAQDAAECVTTSTGGTIPAAKLIVLDSDATASATFCDGSAGYTSSVYLVEPSAVYIGTGHTTAYGTTVDLGAFVDGDELVFSIYVHSTGYTYYTGDGSLNPDGQIHAAVTDLGGGAFHVGFEDLYGGGDRDYDDINIVVQTTGIVIEDHDTDGDTVEDEDDNCIYDANTDQSDGDGDGVGDVCDECPAGGTDPDSDGVCIDDNCPDDANADQEDVDGDGDGDECDVCPNDKLNDADGDSWCADEDNCPDDANSDQANGDDDAFGDECDSCPADALDDADGDGLCADVDYCEGTIADAPLSLGVNRWADRNGDGIFETVSPKGKGPGRSYTIDDTAGCSCEQIADELELGDGHYKFGCSISAMDEWTLMMDAWIAENSGDTGA